jgi:hypothetical protein
MPRAAINTVRQSTFEGPLAIGQRQQCAYPAPDYLRPVGIALESAPPTPLFQQNPGCECLNRCPSSTAANRGAHATCQGVSPSIDFTRLLTWAVSTLVFLGVGHNKFRKLRHKTKPRSQELHTTHSLPLPLPLPI